jgi:hypothetical protein
MQQGGNWADPPLQHLRPEIQDPGQIDPAFPGVAPAGAGEEAEEPETQQGVYRRRQKERQVGKPVTTADRIEDAVAEFLWLVCPWDAQKNPHLKKAFYTPRCYRGQKKAQISGTKKNTDNLPA